MSSTNGAEIGILGGSGLYELTQLEEVEERSVETPFGDPSDVVRIGTLAGRRVAFLARHGPGHRLLPSEINFRANVFAFKTLGVSRILSASAVGSMRESIRPCDVVVVDQFIDRTHHRAATFFGGGLVAHVGLADPVCPELRAAFELASNEAGARVHPRGTYLCVEGPAFSTRAESRLYRSWGVDVIGMTNFQEAKLAREAEICYATLGLVTDYDCWHDEEDDVSVAALLDNLRRNGLLAARVLRDIVERLPAARDACACGDALRDALFTRERFVPSDVRERLRPIVGKYLPLGTRRGEPSGDS